jgi:hypothetical protein
MAERVRSVGSLRVGWLRAGEGGRLTRVRTGSLRHGGDRLSRAHVEFIRSGARRQFAGSANQLVGLGDEPIYIYIYIYTHTHIYGEAIIHLGVENMEAAPDQFV